MEIKLLKMLIITVKNYCIWIASIDIWMNVSLAMTDNVHFEVFHHLRRYGIWCTNHHLRYVLQFQPFSN